MPFPHSPFETDFNESVLFKLGNDDELTTNVNEIQKETLTKTLRWLCQSPNSTTFRVNTLISEKHQVRELIQNHLTEVLGENTQIKAEHHASLNDAIIIKHVRNQSPELNRYEKEVVIDTVCAAAVLRGAHIYAPGVMAMMSGTQVNDNVSIYADTENKCKKGFQKRYQGSKLFIANGVVKLDRQLLFRENAASGTAIQIVENVADCPPLGDNFLARGTALLQNLPSIICVHVLAPQPHETILDMCASPGNKTTHISALMSNTGRLHAVDKTPGKVAQLKRRCEDFSAKNVEILQADSTKLSSKFPAGSFDRILLDAPCSALGKRPQIANTTKVKVLQSYIPLQRKLFENAVALLKPGGTLVYSTCTITLAENEGIVDWAVRTFASVELVAAEPIFGSAGLPVGRFAELRKVQRFGPGDDTDSVGFFIAKFIKK